MKLKTVEIDGKTYAEVDDGKPIFIHDDGKEVGFDAVHALGQINSRQQQNQRVEAENKTLKEKLAAFEGIEDPAAALKAIETVKNFDAKKLIDAGEVEKVKAEAEKAFGEKLTAMEKKFAPIVKERDELQGRLISEKVGGAFSRSKYIADKLIVPADIVEARFGSAFKLEGENVVAYQNGEKIFSRTKPGEVASFDEALEILVDAYPGRANIVKGGGSGTGSGGAGGAAGGVRTMTRAQFSALAPMEQAAAGMKAAKGELKIIDAA